MTSNFPIIDTTQEDFNASNPGSYRDIWSEIIIQAPPATVRAVFLDLERRSNWDPFYKQIHVAKGNIDDCSTEPELTITVNPDCDGKKGFSVPFHLRVYKNEEDGIVWGVKLLNGCLFLVDHVHLFQPLDSGKATRLVNYERQSGPMRYLTNAKTYTRAFQMCNEALKSECEEQMA
jgi:hypothetical protein